MQMDQTVFSTMYLNRESLATLKNRPSTLGGVLCDNKEMFTDRLTHTRSPSNTMPRRAYNILAGNRLQIPKIYIFFLFFFSLLPSLTWSFGGKIKLSRAATQQKQENDMWIQQTPRSAQVDHSLCSPHEGALGPWLSIMCTLKTRIRLGSGQMHMLLCIFAGLQDILLVLSRSGSFCKVINCICIKTIKCRNSALLWMKSTQRPIADFRDR